MPVGSVVVAEVLITLSVRLAFISVQVRHMNVGMARAIIVSVAESDLFPARRMPGFVPGLCPAMADDRRAERDGHAEPDGADEASQRMSPRLYAFSPP